MDGGALLPLPWWAREGVYGSQTVPYYTELDAPVPSAAPNAAPVTIFDGAGVEDEEPVTSATNTYVFQARESPNKKAIRNKQLLARRRAHRFQIESRKHHRGDRFGYIPSAVLRNVLVDELETTQERLYRPVEVPEHLRGNCLRATSETHAVFSPNGSARDLELVDIWSAWKNGKLLVERGGDEKVVASRSRVKGIDATTNHYDGEELFAVSRSATRAYLLRWEGRGSGLRRVAKVGRPNDCRLISAVCVNEWVPGEFTVLRSDRTAEVVRVDNGRKSVCAAEVRGLERAAHSDVGWLSMTRTVHPRGLLVADELNVRRLDLESGTCSKILSSSQWNLALGDRHFKSIISKRDSFHVVLSTHHHVLVCDERFLRMPMVSWTLHSGPTDLLAVESLASTMELVVRIVSGNQSDASCMAYRESTVHSDETFNPGPYVSLGPPLSHLHCPANPSGLAIVRGPSAMSDPVLMVQAGEKGALMVQPITSSTSSIHREPVDSGSETSAVVTNNKRLLDREDADAIESTLERQNDLHEAPQDSNREESFLAFPRTLAEVHDLDRRSEPTPTPKSEDKSFSVSKLDISDDECHKQHGTILVAEHALESLRQAWIPRRDDAKHEKLSGNISKFWVD
ncbi:hypothetical protein NDN08_007941 [Rhodosorus marinus]|uniref:Uncharacterized protein n=1 Tax=Rhodosorus marinus TaxID=101924 RepID=A0AAV8V348_9RHOD|nr:hypothetical protein NDN08_007941 [Rhodosorus marinus]